MKIRQLVPIARELEASELARELEAARFAFAPFDPTLLALGDELSQRLLRDPEARRFPELQALGFWMRRAELERLKKEFAALARPGTRLAPRGLVFHVPPANVDTMFVYSWLFSLLTGNASVIRLSSRESPLTAILCRLLSETLSAGRFSELRLGLAVVAYGHEEEPTAAFSKACDLRVLWGGDEAVNSIRAFPLKPRARDLTFPDRWSFCAMDAAKFLALSETAAGKLTQAFYNDSFWFDQRACSSPRLLVWRGGAKQAEAAGKRLFSGVDALVRAKGPRFETGAVLKKLAFVHEAVLDTPVAAARAISNELTVLPLSDLSRLGREHCGAGLFFQAGVSRLGELSGFLGEKDQTMTTFGFSKAELDKLVAALNGRGLSRVVPVGQALSFSRFWDGYDLLREMTQLVFVGEAGARGR